MSGFTHIRVLSLPPSILGLPRLPAGMVSSPVGGYLSLSPSMQGFPWVPGRGLAHQLVLVFTSLQLEIG